MPDDYKISDLSNVVEISNNDLVEISAVNTSSQTGYSSVKATCHVSKSNCMLNFKEEHLLGIYQTTTDVAKSNNYQS